MVYGLATEGVSMLLTEVELERGSSGVRFGRSMCEMPVLSNWYLAASL